jgi:8-amino-7-oxononanoate synthase
MSAFENSLIAKLSKRKEDGLLRELKNHHGLADFCSNDYLGLSRSVELFEMIQERIQNLHIANGATGSRLLSGNSKLTEEVEQKLSQIFRSESALIFNSGYTANLAVLSSIPQKGDTIIYDELAHACIKDGARLSLAKRYSFRHNDLDDLEGKIKKATGKIYIAIESVYSMDGDESPLNEIVLLAERYGGSIILDEAHSTGAYGESGSGMATALDLHKSIAIRIYTFGKAMGIHGACVAGSANLIKYLINFGRPFIYTTALPPHSIIAIDCAFQFLSKNIHLQKQLQSKISTYAKSVETSINKIKSKSAIQTAIFEGNENAKIASKTLQGNGFDIRPILSPTVPVGKERLRICLHTFNPDQEIHSMCALLTQLATPE